MVTWELVTAEILAALFEAFENESAKCKCAV